MDAITAIKSRTSVRHFSNRPIARELIEQLLDCAVRAPNHKLTQPWRFAVLTGAARDRFAEIRARHRLKRFTDPTSPEAQAAAGTPTSRWHAQPPHRRSWLLRPGAPEQHVKRIVGLSPARYASGKGDA